MGFTQVGFVCRKAEVFLSRMGTLLGMKCVLGKARKAREPSNEWDTCVCLEALTKHPGGASVMNSGS